MMRILLAEDNPVFQLVLQKQLAIWGYEVDTVADGAVALDSLSSSNGPRLAILDWNMPGLSGPEVCARVRKARTSDYVYLVLLTAREDNQDLIEGLESGADDYLTKPVNMNELRLRLRAGRRVLAYEARARQLFEGAPVAYHETDSAGVITRANQAEADMLGFSTDQIVGRSVWDFVVPSERARYLEAFREAFAGGYFGSEWQYVCSSGEVLRVAVQQNHIRDDSGAIVGLRATMLDVTELRRQGDLLQLRAAELSQSNADLERFAHVAAHDLQEPLRIVENCSQLLAARYAGRLGRDAEELIAHSLSGAGRIRTLLASLQSLAQMGIGSSPLSPTDLDDVVARSLANLGDTVGGCRVRHGGLPTVQGDREQLVQLFQSLIEMAAQSSTGTGSVDVSSRRVDMGWEISVCDKRSPSDSERRLSPIRTSALPPVSHDDSHNGFDLTACRTIAERHGGHICVASLPGGGKAIRFTIPAAVAEEGVRLAG